MTPKQRALDLFEKYLTPNLVSPLYGALSYQDAKQCTLVAVDEIVNIFKSQMPPLTAEYWRLVKEEVEKL